MDPSNTIQTYIRRLGWALAPLPREDRDEILSEARGHLHERAALSEAELSATIRAFGPPEDYAQAFIDEYRLAGASATSPRSLVAAGVTLATKGIGGFLGVLLLTALYLGSLSLVVIAVLKPILPGQVGLFTGEDIVALGVFDRATTAGADEALGYWIVPLGIAGALLLYLAATWLLRRFLKLFLSRRDTSLPRSHGE